MDLTVVLAACERYQTMQEAHVQRFAAAGELDLVHLLFEREQHCTDLYNQLTTLRQHLHLHPDRRPLAACIQERLERIQQRDAVLMTHLQVYRALLAQRRDQLHYGQRVLHGYSGTSRHPPPQLLDMSS